MSVVLLLSQDDGGSGTPAGPDELSPTGSVATAAVGATDGAATGAVGAADPPATASSTPTPTAEPTPTASATPARTAEPTVVSFSEADVEAFLVRLGAAGRTSDVDSLMGWLHPAVFERYGEANCRSYLETTELALDVTVREVAEPAPWEWLTDDGGGGRFDEALEIEIARLVGSQTLVQLLHLVPLDGELTWLTDCGEPAP